MSGGPPEPSSSHNPNLADLKSIISSWFLRFQLSSTQDVLLRPPCPSASSSLLCKLLYILRSDTGLRLVTSSLTSLAGPRQSNPARSLSPPQPFATLCTPKKYIYIKGRHCMSVCHYITVVTDEIAVALPGAS